MQKLFLPYELAVIAKEKGFDEPCIAEYYKGLLTFYKNLDESFKSELDAECDHLMTYTNSRPNHNDKENTYCAPLYQQIVDWFKREHNIYLQILAYTTVDAYHYEIIDLHSGFNKSELKGRHWQDHYDCFNQAVQEAFKLI